MNFIFKPDEIYDKNMIIIQDEYFKELKNKLSNVKGLIDNYPKEWESIKKYIHQYEYIYISSKSYKNISKISPISRSYFKLREILYDYNLLNNNHKNYKITCLAEAPGGFIQSLLHHNEKNITNIHAITLLSENKKIPTWNRILKTNKKIKFHTGIKKMVIYLI